MYDVLEHFRVYVFGQCISGCLGLGLALWYQHSVVDGLDLARDEPLPQFVPVQFQDVTEDVHVQVVGLRVRIMIIGRITILLEVEIFLYLEFIGS